MGETTDLLRLGVKKARGCAQRFRQLVRGELNLRALDAALRSGGGCQGHGCDQCAEAALRAIDVTAWATGPAAARQFGIGFGMRGLVLLLTNAGRICYISNWTCFGLSVIPDVNRSVAIFLLKQRMWSALCWN